MDEKEKSQKSLEKTKFQIIQPRTEMKIKIHEKYAYKSKSLSFQKRGISKNLKKTFIISTDHEISKRREKWRALFGW